MTHLKILIVDDSDEDFETIVDTLKEGTEFELLVERAKLGSAGLDLINNRHFDCILLDFNLPDMSGLDILECIDASEEDLPPIIFLTGQGSENIAVRALKLGASDYISKKYLQDACLLLAIDNAIESKRWTRETKRVKNKLHEEGLRNIVEHSRQLMEAQNKVSRYEGLSKFFEKAPWPMAQLSGHDLIIDNSNAPMRRLIANLEASPHASVESIFGNELQGLVKQVMKRGLGIEVSHLLLKPELAAQNNMQLTYNAVIEPTWNSKNIVDGAMLMLSVSTMPETKSSVDIVH